MVLIFLDVDTDGTLSRSYRQCVDILDNISTHRALLIIESF
jgi:hypothetical protein